MRLAVTTLFLAAFASGALACPYTAQAPKEEMTQTVIVWPKPTSEEPGA